MAFTHPHDRGTGLFPLLVVTPEFIGLWSWPAEPISLLDQGVPFPGFCETPDLIFSHERSDENSCKKNLLKYPKMQEPGRLSDHAVHGKATMGTNGERHRTPRREALITSGFVLPQFGRAAVSCCFLAKDCSTTPPKRDKLGCLLVWWNNFSPILTMVRSSFTPNLGGPHARL